MDINRVGEYIEAVGRRFQRMAAAGIDTEGIAGFHDMIDSALDNEGRISPGQLQYLLDRTHPCGILPDYRTHRGYDRLYGSIPDCPVRDLVAMTDWGQPVPPRLKRQLKQLGIGLPGARPKPRPRPVTWGNGLFTQI
jgi:hypothetical protein